MRRIADFTSKKPEPTEGTVIVASVDELTAKTLEILRREITNLMIESSAGKLAPPSSKSLVDYIKLLDDLKQKEKELLEEASTEFLQRLAKDK